MKKLEKNSSEASNKGSGDEDSDKESNRDEDFDDERISKRGYALGSMSAEQIRAWLQMPLKLN